ncbi:MAG: tyrosine-type recombinase/integrase [Clostridia bacterium]|nr:tyrosine-type recombinase/integrase [Clostridia bacterium]
MKTLSDYATEFFKSKKLINLVNESLITYKSHLNCFVPWCEERGLQEPKITQELIDEYVIYMVDKKLSAKTINNRLKTINQFIDFMRKKGVKIKSSIKANMVKKTESVKKTLKTSEMKRIIDNLDITNRDSVLVVFLLSTGVRSKTVRLIKFGDIDFDNSILELQHMKNRKFNNIPLPSVLVDILKAYAAHFNLKKDDYLFFNNYRNQLTRSTIYERIRRYLETIGVEQHGVHIFRHSFAKVEVLNGIDSVSLQRLMTHQSIEESSRYVDLYSPELLKKQNQFNILTNQTYQNY